MEAKKTNVALITLALGSALLAVRVLLSVVWGYLPIESSIFIFLSPVSIFYSSLLNLLAIAAHITLLSYGYILFRKILPSRKAHWFAVLTSTTALTLPKIVNVAMVMQPGTEIDLNLLVILSSLCVNFLLSLGAVYLIAAIYKKRSGLEVEQNQTVK